MILLYKIMFLYSFLASVSYATEITFKININESKNINVILWKGRHDDYISSKAQLSLIKNESNIISYECKALFDRNLSEEEINNLTVTVSGDLSEPIIINKYAEVNYKEITNRELDITCVRSAIDVTRIYQKDTKLIYKVTSSNGFEFIDMTKVIEIDGKNYFSSISGLGKTRIMVSDWDAWQDSILNKREPDWLIWDANIEVGKDPVTQRVMQK